MADRLLCRHLSRDDADGMAPKSVRNYLGLS
jgi:hypothetical protein